MQINYRVISEYFKENSVLANLINNYIYRDDQVELAQAIYKNFSDKEFLVGEVGTGVGKTYAYLVPAVLWATVQKERVIISTKTKALQQQLVEKDLPNVVKALNSNIKSVEAKGRENYLCWNKYIKILAGRKKLDSKEAKFIEKIIVWAEHTKTGDKKELELNSELMSYWWIVASDRKSCEKDVCPYHDKCFRLKMIRSLEKADVIVVNHALLLSDIVVDNSILPEYKYLIIDEAHNIDHEAFARLTNRVTFTDFRDVLKGLHNKSHDKGLLSKIQKDNPEKKIVIEECISLVDRAGELIDELKKGLNSLITKSNIEPTLSIVLGDIVDEPGYEIVYDIYLEAIEVLNRLIVVLESLNIEDINFTVNYSILKELSETLYTIVEEDLQNNNNLVWLEYNQGELTSLVSSVIGIGSVLYESLYQRLDSLIMLSATVTIDNKFDFFLNKTGLSFMGKDERLNTFIGKSPFCYEKQANMLIVNDLPQPDRSNFLEEVTEIIKKVVNITRGRTLVLFTSRKQMKFCTEKLRAFCKNNELQLLVQNDDGEAANIINTFINNKNSILFGLDSFWEGIDLKGELLTCLIIVKLPFKAPGDPLSCAYDKYSKTLGVSSFNAFLLPDAIMRFKQGIGRLIRSETDYGTVIVLDNRLLTKSYGESFIKSIPIKNVQTINRNSIDSMLINGLD